MGGVVAKDDLEDVANFGVEDGAEDAEVLLFGAARLERGEVSVGVFAVDGFFVDAADLVRARFGEALGDEIEVHAHGFIAAGGSVVPVHFVGCDVIGARCARGLRQRGMSSKHEEGCAGNQRKEDARVQVEVLQIHRDPPGRSNRRRGHAASRAQRDCILRCSD